MRKLLFAAAMVLVIAGCGRAEQPAQSLPTATANQDQLRGKTFVSETVTEHGKPRPLAQGSQIQVAFGGDGSMSANAGCNGLGGQVRLNDGKLAANEPGLFQTEKSCGDALNKQDEWLAAFMHSKPAWQLDGPALRMTSADTEIKFRTGRSLTGNRWELENGKATLTFDQGQAVLTSECNSGQAEYTVDGTTLRIGTFGLTRKGCPDEMMAGERTITETVTGDVTMKQDGDSLQLTNQSGGSVKLLARQ